jgi:hypothetical protein
MKAPVDLKRETHLAATSGDPMGNLKLLTSCHGFDPRAFRLAVQELQAELKYPDAATEAMWDTVDNLFGFKRPAKQEPPCEMPFTT